eukprot:8875058-Pyramimonas_sp.AAC.1
MITSTNSAVVRPGRVLIKTVQDAVYLGGMLFCDGTASPEVTRRLGEAQRVFNQLAKLWSHTVVGWKENAKYTADASWMNCCLRLTLCGYDNLADAESTRFIAGGCGAFWV